MHKQQKCQMGYSLGTCSIWVKQNVKSNMKNSVVKSDLHYATSATAHDQPTSTKNVRLVNDWHWQNIWILISIWKICWIRIVVLSHSRFVDGVTIANIVLNYLFLELRKYLFLEDGRSCRRKSDAIQWNRTPSKHWKSFIQRCLEPQTSTKHFKSQ